MRNVVLEGENDQLKRTGSKPTLAEEAAQAAKAAAVAAADMAKASQELLASKIEGGWIKLQFNPCKISINVLIQLIFCFNTTNFCWHLLLLNNDFVAAYGFTLRRKEIFCTSSEPFG